MSRAHVATSIVVIFWRPLIGILMCLLGVSERSGRFTIRKASCKTGVPIPSGFRQEIYFKRSILLLGFFRVKRVVTLVAIIRLGFFRFYSPDDHFNVSFQKCGRGTFPRPWCYLFSETPTMLALRPLV